MAKLLNPAIVARPGKKGLQKVLSRQVVSFIADDKEIGRNLATTITTDPSGNRGLAYYMQLHAPLAQVGRAYTYGYLHGRRKRPKDSGLSPSQPPRQRPSLLMISLA
jgi:hypothetical protein